MARSVVNASHHQYQVAGGSDTDPVDGQADLPGVAIGISRESFSVITGIAYGHLTVETDALVDPPDSLADDWDVVGEIDVSTPTGSILVYDMFGGPSDGLTDLAAAGPGLYRVRVHAKNREAVEEEESTEVHWLIGWPVSEASPPRLLAGLDTYGRYFTGELKPPEPDLDDVNAAVAWAVEVLAQMVESGERPSLSGQVRTLWHDAVIEAPAAVVYEIVSSPRSWVGIGGSGGPYPAFDLLFSNPVLRANDPAQITRQIHARGQMLIDRRDHVSFTWAWLVPNVPRASELNLKERLHAILTGDPFPDPPEVIDVRIADHGPSTSVQVTITEVPVEHADVTDAVWAWAMKRLARRATKQPGQMFPWGNYY